MFPSYSAWAKAILVALTLCLLPGVVSADRFVEESDVVQWQVANTDTVQGNEEYQLHSLRRRSLNFSSQLGYVRGRRCKPGSRTFICELGWPGHSGGHFVFVRHNKNDHSPISDTEVVAIYNTLTKRYLVHEGAAKFSSRESHEWILRHRNGVDFALYNTNRGGYLKINGEELYFTAPGL